MPRYCKAYYLKDLRKFPQWREHAADSEKAMEDEDIVYIEETLFVTKNCLELDKKEDYIFDHNTPEWETYCKEELSFEIPDWEEESRRVREELIKQGHLKAEDIAESPAEDPNQTQETQEVAGAAS